MPLKVEKPDDLVKEIRVQIGKEFIHRSFGQPVERRIAGAHAITMVTAMCGINLDEEPTP